MNFYGSFLLGRAKSSSGPYMGLIGQVNVVLDPFQSLGVHGKKVNSYLFCNN